MTTIRLSLLLLLTLSCHRETPVPNDHATTQRRRPAVATAGKLGPVEIQPLMSGLPTAETAARALTPTSATSTCVPEANVSVTPEPGTVDVEVQVGGKAVKVRNLRRNRDLWTFTVDSPCGVAHQTFDIVLVGSSCSCGGDARKKCPCSWHMVKGEFPVRRGAALGVPP
jgi:hypothetical protein